MRRSTGDQEVAGSTPAEVGNILSWRLIMKYFLRSFSPFCWLVILSLLLIQEGQLSVSGERMCTILVNRLEDWACPVNVWLGKLTALDMTPLGWLGRKTSTQTNQLDAPSDWRPGGRGFNPRRGRQHSFVEIDHEIFSTVILSLPLIQERQLSVSGERMCTILVKSLEDWACPVNVWLGKLTALDMTQLGWLGRKTSTQTNKQWAELCPVENFSRLFVSG